jgi:hypothetical protein
MIPGIEIFMGGKEWTVPPLTLSQLRRLGPKIRAMKTVEVDGLTEEVIDAMGDIVATALARNYPEETPETVLELLDMGNAQNVLEAVLVVGSGLRRAKPGEVKAVTNGATYTGSSPPPADTATP